MKNNSASTVQPSNGLTEKNLGQLPSDIQVFYAFLEKNKNKVLAPEKYYSSQKTLVKIELKALFEQQPDLPLQSVAARILADLPDFVPADKIVELTRFTLRTWEKLRKKEVVLP